MDVRSLRRKRIAIIVTVVVLLAGVVGVVYMVQKGRSAQRVAALRAEGLAAYEAGDYAQAVAKLGPYAEQHIMDGEVWYAYGRAELLTPSEDQSHIDRALRALSHVVQTLEPDNLDAARDLLELNMLVRRDDRALELADRILEIQPDNETILRHKVVALTRLNQNEEAWRLGRELIGRRPQDLEMQLAVIQLRYALGHTADSVIGDARALRDEHPDDPRFELVLGAAMLMGGREQEGLDHLRTAAGWPMPEDTSLVTVVRLLDQAGLFDQSLRVLVEQVTAQSSDLLIEEKLYRCFEAGLLDEVERLLADRDVTAPHEPARIAAIAAITAQQRGDARRAQQMLDALRSRPDEAHAIAWAEALEALLARGLTPDAGAVNPLRRAVDRHPRSAYLHSLLGDALAAADETAQAAAHWRRAAELRDVWDAPLRQLARYHLAVGQVEQATRYAEMAFTRRPSSADNALLVAQVRAATLRPNDAAGLDRIMNLLDEIDRVIGSPARTLVLRVNTLIHVGRVDMVRQVIEDVIEQQPPLPRGAVDRLIELSREYEMDLEQRLRAMLDTTADPDAAAEEAIRLVHQGRISAALQGIESRRVAGDPRWEVAVARVLDAAGDDRAAAMWRDLADRYEDEARIQIMALRSAALAEDRDTAARIVDRLRRLGGESGAVWRVEQARWLLRQPGRIDDALGLLRDVLAQNPQHFEARVLTARAHQQAGRLPLAVRELQAALVQRPDALGLKLDLAQLYQQMRSYEVAADHLNQIVLHPAASPALLRRAALMLAQQGADERAIAVLQEIKDRSAEARTVDDLLLASLYRRNGMTSQAEQVCRHLLETPTLDGVQFVAGFYATQNRGEEAQRVLALIEDIDAPEDRKQAARASYYARYGSPDEALTCYRRAVEAAPENLAHWTRLILFELTIGEIDAALADAERAVRQLGEAPSLRTLKDHAPLVRRFAADPRGQALVAAIVAEPAEREAAVEALRALDQAPDDPAAQAAALDELTETYGHSLTLRLVQVRAYLEAGDTHQAAELATRAMYAHPMSVDAAWLAAEALTAEQRWPEALAAASQWRQRSAGQSMNADLIIAESQLRLGAVEAAEREIRPYLQAALADPKSYPAVIFSYARILVAEGRAAEARQLLRPLLDEDASWRTLWARIASLAIGDTNVAAQWLTDLESFVPADAAEEQAQLAQGWWALYLRSSAEAHREAAARWIDRATAGAEAPASSWMLKGVVHELAGRYGDAEEAYRQALQRDPSLHAAANNLAMVLLRRGGDLDEATRLARQATDANPQNAEFLDTLARVHAQGGRYDDAIAAMRRAVEADPGRAAWQWSLLDLYEAAGREGQADQLRNQLELQYPLGRPAEADAIVIQ